MLPVPDGEGESLKALAAGHHRTLKVFKDGVEAFTTAAPILNVVDDGLPHRVKNLLLVLAPPFGAELAVHLHHGGLVAEAGKPLRIELGNGGGLPAHAVGGVGDRIQPSRRRKGKRSVPIRVVCRGRMWGWGCCRRWSTCNGDPAAVVGKGEVGPRGTVASTARERNEPVPSQLIQDLLVLLLEGGQLSAVLLSEGGQLSAVLLSEGRQLVAVLLP